MSRKSIALNCNDLMNTINRLNAISGIQATKGSHDKQVKADYDPDNAQSAFEMLTSLLDNNSTGQDGQFNPNWASDVDGFDELQSAAEAHAPVPTTPSATRKRSHASA